MTRPRNPAASPLGPIRLHDLTPQEFSAIAEPYRRALLAHCYRMLGSIQDAEDLVQESLLRAWQRRETYAGRAPVRAWLYKIATNLCLDTLAQRQRRTLPVAHQAAADLDDPIPPDVNEPIWLEPFPDALLAPAEMMPEARFAARERVDLAFLVLLQQLPPRQRAVLLLRDVLEWQASEVAQLLDLSVSAVKSLLFRARQTLTQQTDAFAALAETRLAQSDAVTQTLLQRYTTAWEEADIAGLVALLKEDATFSMPPIPAWYQGRQTIAGLVAKTVFRGPAQGRWRLEPTRANGQPAFGLYRIGDQQPDGTVIYQAYGIQVVTVTGPLIADITTFRVSTLFAKFGLPSQLFVSK
ncbi:MAG: sigma-70 family RNA polymerase sigma factor [Caldilinea sp. CFX5]|nr:sigma-70 family RNA polymerase sigma factor [Caldilinea sp. CFX5]